MIQKGRLVIIVDYDVVNLYNRVPAKEPDKQLIIYGKSVIEKDMKPTLKWTVWLSMLKGYQTEMVAKDKWYDTLREILVYLFGDQTVKELVGVKLTNINIWGLGNGKD